jgi:hypothetical protein
MVVRFEYRNLGMPDLFRRGLRPETADLGVLLVDIEADLVLRVDGRVVFAEGAFPVAELARALAHWLHRPDGERGDFVFDSMSYQDAGEVRIVEFPEGWRIGSASEPGAWSPPIPWAVLAVAAGQYVSAVRGEVAAMGVRAGVIPVL